MPFSEDDLKRLISVSNNPQSGSSSIKNTLILALLARLEAAEALLVYQECHCEPTVLGSVTCDYCAWRKEVGK